MKTFKKFVEECNEIENISEAEFNPRWWNSKSDTFKKRYIERHPNSIYAKKFGGGKLDKEIARKQRAENAKQREVEKDISGNKAWMQTMARNLLKKDSKGHPVKALTPRYRKNLIKGAEDVYGKDSKQAKRARELWGEKPVKKPSNTISVDDLEKIRTKSGNVNLNKLRALLGQPPLESKKKPAAKKAPKEQPADKWVDDAFDEANLHFKWQKAKQGMGYHGVDQHDIKDIINSGKYEPEEIIDALNSRYHDKIDAMKDSVKKNEDF